MLVHTFGGCSKTSAVHGQDIILILILLEKSKTARRKTDVFLQKDRIPEKICEVGIRIFVMS